MKLPQKGRRPLPAATPLPPRLSDEGTSVE